MNVRNVEVVKTLYNQMPSPKVVVAVGICATSGCVFQDAYNVLGGVDKVLPVDVYVLGCAVRPEAVLDGILKAAEVLEEKYRAFRAGKLRRIQKKLRTQSKGRTCSAKRGEGRFYDFSRG